MDKRFSAPSLSTRRCFLGAAGAATLAPVTALAENMVKLPLPGGPDERAITTAFPQKGALILQRTRPPLLETPMDVFDRSVFTPNDLFYVRWHWAGIPNEIDVNSFRLTVHGHVNRTVSLSLDELLALPQMELAAVNQCSGNSRGYFQPRVSGAQWSNGAMGNARWAGVSVNSVLDRAGVKAGAVQVRFKGLDDAVLPDTETDEIARCRPRARWRGHARLRDERRAASAAQRLPAAADRAGLVLHVLGQDA